MYIYLIYKYTYNREIPAFGGGTRKKIGAPAALHSFKNFRRVMRMPNMCLVLKLDNVKVVSIANRQTDTITESPNHPVPYYYIDTLWFYRQQARLQISER